MLKKTITYTDYNGVERTEDFYFNLNRSELSKMEITTAGGLVAMLERIVAAKDGKAIMNTVEAIIHQAYGEKSPDGKRFEKKNGALADAFEETEPYNMLFMELVTDAVAAASFVKGILPEDLQKAVAEEEAKN